MTLGEQRIGMIQPKLLFSDFNRQQFRKRGWKESDESSTDGENAALIFNKDALEIQVSMATDDRNISAVHVVVQGNGIHWTE